MPGQFAKTDGGICADAWLLIVCRLGQLPEELSIDGPVGEFGNQDEN